MRILLDTNVWLAAFLTHGACQELMEYCLESHTFLISDFILEEIEEKLGCKFAFPKKRVVEIISFVRENTECVEVSSLSKPVCRDRDDDQILAAAVSGGADFLITGDEDLLSLGLFDGIPILRPSQFWIREKD